MTISKDGKLIVEYTIVRLDFLCPVCKTHSVWECERTSRLAKDITERIETGQPVYCKNCWSKVIVFSW